MTDKYYYKDGSILNYRDNKILLHREDGPAIELANGDKHWYINGKRHRENGPAIEYADGDKQWYINGKLHREDGPAREWFDYSGQRCSDRIEWYLDDEPYTKKEFETKLKEIDSLSILAKLTHPKKWIRERAKLLLRRRK